MPSAHPFTNASRTVKEIHADWWNPMRTDDGTLHGTQVSEDEPGKYVERVEIYEEMYGSDTMHVKTKLFRTVDITKSSDPKNAAQLARQRFYLFERMIVLITDKRGNSVPLNDTFMLTAHERDLQFIEEEIENLKKPPIPVIEQDIIRSEEEAHAYDIAVANGARPDMLRKPRTAEELATEDFR